jgi:serine protease
MISPRRTGACLAAAVFAAGLLGAISLVAQAPAASPYSMILTSQRALEFVQAAADRLDYLPGEVLVKFKAGVGTAGEQSALLALRSQPSASSLRWIGDVAVVRDQSEWNADILAEQLREQPEVEYAEPNYIRRPTGVPNDPGYADQWNMDALDMPRAWDINPGANAKVTIAIVDTGITTVSQTLTFSTWNGTAIQDVGVPFAVNPDLPAARLVQPVDLAFWNGPVLDMQGHGTHVSGTAGESTNNNLGDAGIAYQANIMPVKVCLGFWELQFAMSADGMTGSPSMDAGGCPDDLIIEGIRYAADHGAQVINLSLGGPDANPLLEDALNYAVTKGAFVAIAAGNSYESGNAPQYPAAYAPDIDGVMAVGAVGRSLQRAYYSETGPYIEIAAPGGDDRDGGISGGIWQSTILESDSVPGMVLTPRFDRYGDTPYEGTSMAAPHVAGAAALIVSQGVTKPAAMEALITMTAKDLGAPGRDDEYGSGLIQPRTAIFGFGYGR